jgi:hypothetical protein
VGVIDQNNAPAVTIATARGLPKVVVDRVDDHLTAIVWYLGGAIKDTEALCRANQLR